MTRQLILDTTKNHITSPVITYAVIGNRQISITKSGSVYVTRVPTTIA